MASLFSTSDIFFVVTVSSSQRVSLRSSCQQLTFQTCFNRKDCRLAASALLFSSVRGAVWRGKNEFKEIAINASASCGRDEIETVYCLRVVIETPRIEL